jgi:hypothetical protein
MSDELVNTDMLRALNELLKTLPTRDFELNFLADIFMVLTQMLTSYK